jgi:hypothetical protein
MALGIIGAGVGGIMAPKMDAGIIGVGAGKRNIVTGIATTMTEIGTITITTTTTATTIINGFRGLAWRRG